MTLDHKGFGASTLVYRRRRLAKSQRAADVDVVIDYTWGAPTQQAIPALLTRRTERSKPLDWIQIGSMAGSEIALPSFVLRAANLRIMGSGQGSVTAAGIIAELPSLIDQLSAGTHLWSRPGRADPGHRPRQREHRVPATRSCYRFRPASGKPTYPSVSLDVVPVSHVHGVGRVQALIS